MQTLSLQKLKQEAASGRIQVKSVSDFPINEIVFIDITRYIDCIPYIRMAISFQTGIGPLRLHMIQYYLTYGDLHPDVVIYIRTNQTLSPPHIRYTYYDVYLHDTLAARWSANDHGGMNTIDGVYGYLSPIIFKKYQQELEQFNAIEKLILDQSKLNEKYIHSLENRVKSLEKAQRQKINSQTIDSSFLFKQQQQPLIDLQYNPKELRKKRSKDLKKDAVNKARQLQQALM